MRKRRILWLLSLLAAVGLYLFDNHGGTRLILAAVGLLPLCSGPPLLLMSGLASLEGPETLARGERGRWTLAVRDTGCFPAPCVRCTAAIRNRMTGENTSIQLAGAVRGAGERTLAFTVTPLHCGTLEVAVTGLYLTDVFGVWAKRVELPPVRVCPVLPECHALETELADTAEYLSDSERYSARRPGYDPSETFRIREYVPGDPIRQIHWKLSEKTDTTLVRDLGLPIVSDLLLLWDAAVPPGGEPDRVDMALDILSSVAGGLLEQGISYALGWKEGDEVATREIRTGEELLEARERLLDVPPEAGALSASEAYVRSRLSCPYAHIVIVAPEPPPDSAVPGHGSRVTTLIPGPAAPEEDGLLPVSMDELREGVLRLEL